LSNISELNTPTGFGNCAMNPPMRERNAIVLARFEELAREALETEPSDGHPTTKRRQLDNQAFGESSGTSISPKPGYNDRPKNLSEFHPAWAVSFAFSSCPPNLLMVSQIVGMVPPSMTNSLPVMAEALSDARKATIPPPRPACSDGPGEYRQACPSAFAGPLRNPF